MVLSDKAVTGGGVFWVLKHPRNYLQFFSVSQPLPSLSLCNRQFFTKIHFLLKVVATLPVSSATAEQTCSTLKRLKTYLRNATGQDRLTGLALMSVHRDIDVNIQRAIAEETQTF